MLGNSYIVQVDSDNRLSGTHSNFEYRIPLTDENYDSVAVLSASIPKTYYLVDTGRNTFTLTENTTTHTITIPKGNYSTESFKTTLTSLLNSTGSYIYTITFIDPEDTTQASTGLYTITVSGNSSVQPIISFPSTSTLYRQFGFDKESTNTFSSDAITSTNVVDFQLSNALYIKSDIFQSKSTVLQEVFFDNSYDFSRIGFQNTTLPYSAKKLSTNDKQAFNFSITDTDDNILNLNGHAVNFTLVLFRRNIYPEHALKNMVIQNNIDELKQTLSDISNWDSAPK